MLPVSSVKDRSVTTLEGLSQTNNELHPIQKAFVLEQAAQCGYCMNGMVMTAVALAILILMTKLYATACIYHFAVVVLMPVFSTQLK